MQAESIRTSVQRLEIGILSSVSAHESCVCCVGPLSEHNYLFRENKNTRG